MTFKSITVGGLVALVWTALVAFYVLNGLGPHGYIDGTADAVWTALIWFVAGGLVLGWFVRQILPIIGWKRTVGGAGASGQIATGQSDAASADGWVAGRNDTGLEECGLRMGVAGFGYYYGAVKTDDD